MQQPKAAESGRPTRHRPAARARVRAWVRLQLAASGSDGSPLPRGRAVNRKGGKRPAAAGRKGDMKKLGRSQDSDDYTDDSIGGDDEGSDGSM
jgi:hypothetical protein